MGVAVPDQGIGAWAPPAPAATGAAALALTPLHWAALAAGGLAMAVLVAAAPLAVYGLAIALFGLPHVLAELRFLDARYSPGIGRPLLRSLLVLLVGACALRLAGSYGWLSRDLAIPGELLLVAATAFPLRRHLGSHRWLGWLVTAGFAAAAAAAPFHTLLVLAVAHNLTPIAFVGHALRDRPGQAAPAAAAALVLFGVIPVAIVLGLGGALTAALGIAVGPDAAVIPSGPLGKHLGTVVPPEITDPRLTFNLFAAAVYLQCVHYAAVIHFMPRLLPTRQPPTTLAGWPRHRWMQIALASVGLATGIAFAADFGEARKLYATIAAFHAWIEVPILLLMVAGCLAPSALRPNPANR